jgi:hypothetical protein
MVDNGEPSVSTPFNNVQASIMQNRNSQKKRKQSISFLWLKQTKPFTFFSNQETIDCNIQKMPSSRSYGMAPSLHCRHSLGTS